MTLDAIGLKHGTDKSSLFHDYLNRYEPMFARFLGKPVQLLEIGVAGGASLRTWMEYFGHDGMFFGIDIDLPAVAHDLGPRCLLRWGDASKAEVWSGLHKTLDGSGLDIVIDDGAHTTYAIIRAFELGFGLLRPGGLWVIEDVHAVYLPAYNRDNFLLGERLKPTDNAVRFFAEMVHHVNDHGKGQCGKREPAFPIASITFSKSLIIIERA